MLMFWNPEVFWLKVWYVENLSFGDCMSVTVVFDPLTVSLLPKQVCWSHLILRYKDQLSRIKMVRKLPLLRNGVNVSVSTVYLSFIRLCVQVWNSLVLNSPEKYSYLPEHNMSRTFLVKKKKKKKDINCINCWCSYIHLWWWLRLIFDKVKIRLIRKNMYLECIKQLRTFLYLTNQNH